MKYETIKLPANATIGTLTYWASTEPECKQVIKYIEGLDIGLACVECEPFSHDGYLVYFENMG